MVAAGGMVMLPLGARDWAPTMRHSVNIEMGLETEWHL